MPNFDLDSLLQFFSQYIYSPGSVYLWVSLFLLAGSFGLPVPEELVLVSVGLVAYMGTRPDLYPPPFEGAPKVDGYLAALIAFLAVIISDMTVYFIGRYLGQKARDNQRLKRWLKPELMDKINAWTQKYGIWASGIFRFTPALRFPGFLSCGILGIRWWQFLAIDGTAALLSVPTQVILVYLYGETILTYFKKFKIVVFSLLAVALIFFIVKKVLQWRKNKKALKPTEGPT